MGSTNSAASLPPQTEDHVVDVSFRHLMLVLGALVASGVALSASLLIVKDYLRLQRQEMLMRSIREIITTLMSERRDENADDTS